MKNWRQYKQFIGSEVRTALVIAFIIGLMISVVEIIFALLIQLFLIKIDAMSFPSGDSLGAIVVRELSAVTMLQAMGLLIAGGALRGIIQGVREYWNGAAVELFIAHHRKKILNWVFNSRSINQSEAIGLFTERVHRASLAVGSTGRIFSLAMTILGIFFALLTLAAKATLVSMLILGVIAIYLRKIDAKIGTVGSALVSEWDRLNQRLVRSIKNLFLIRIYGTRHREEDLTKGNVDHYLNRSLLFFKLIALKTALPQIAGLCVLCAAAVLNIRSGWMAGATLLTYFYLFIRMVQAFSELAANIAQFKVNEPQVLALMDWSQKSETEKNLPPQEAVNSGALSEVGWKAENISFGYSEDQSVIQNLSFEIKPKNALIIIGPSGVGKSTLLNLMTRGISPTSGRIHAIDSQGRKIEVSDEKLLASLGYVGPESFLFDGTVLENLKYGLLTEPSSEQVSDALKLANCEFVYAYPQKLKHRITDQGDGISAGQKQRLALARALLRNPSALILDEATANLDVQTEAKLIETLHELKTKMTLVVVTHRESLLVLADQTLKL
jgi:ATP-binding cassette subfamily B protein AbcA/BmrA